MRHPSKVGAFCSRKYRNKLDKAGVRGAKYPRRKRMRFVA